MMCWHLLGLDTLELIELGEGIERDPLEMRGGPTISYDDFGGNSDKILFLRPDHLKLLYERFKAANPKGAVIVTENGYYEHIPPGMSFEQCNKLENEGKIFLELFLDDLEHVLPRLREYLPELFEPGVIDQMAADPWLNLHLLHRAMEQGFVPMEKGDGARWSPEWRAYCDRLIASGEDK
jgi:hypothetical protein